MDVATLLKLPSTPTAPHHHSLSRSSPTNHTHATQSQPHPSPPVSQSRQPHPNHVRKEHQVWFQDIKQELLLSEPQNIAARAQCCQNIINECISHLNMQLGLQQLAASQQYKCNIDARQHLKFLTSWPGLRIGADLRKGPQTKREYEKKAKNWLNGRRAPNYGKTLFPQFIEEAEKYSDKVAKLLIPNNDSHRQSLYYKMLIYKVLAQLCGCSVSLNEQAKKAPFFCKNSIERKGRLKEMLQAYAYDHQYIQGFPSCFEEAIDYFEEKSNQFFAQYRQRYMMTTTQNADELAMESNTKRTNSTSTSSTSTSSSTRTLTPRSTSSVSASSSSACTVRLHKAEGMHTYKIERHTKLPRRRSTQKADERMVHNVSVSSSSPMKTEATSKFAVSEPPKKRQRTAYESQERVIIKHETPPTTTTSEPEDVVFWRNKCLQLQQQLSIEQTLRAQTEKERDECIAVLSVMHQNVHLLQDLQPVMSGNNEVTMNNSNTANQNHTEQTQQVTSTPQEKSSQRTLNLIDKLDQGPLSTLFLLNNNTNPTNLSAVSSASTESVFMPIRYNVIATPPILQPENNNNNNNNPETAVTKKQTKKKSPHKKKFPVMSAAVFPTGNVNVAANTNATSMPIPFLSVPPNQAPNLNHVRVLQPSDNHNNIGLNMNTTNQTLQPLSFVPVMAKPMTPLGQGNNMEITDEMAQSLLSLLNANHSQ